VAFAAPCANPITAFCDCASDTKYALPRICALALPAMAPRVQMPKVIVRRMPVKTNRGNFIVSSPQKMNKKTAIVKLQLPAQNENSPF
jgi:hypothetical protein